MADIELTFDDLNEELVADTKEADPFEAVPQVAASNENKYIIPTTEIDRTTVTPTFLTKFPWWALELKTLNLIGGHTGNGKSMVLKNMATNALTDSDKTSVLYITSEDKPVKIAQAMEKLAPELFKDPKLNERMIIYFNKDINIFDVQALVKQYPTDYVFIDYLQLIGLKSELPLTMKMLSKVIEDSNSIWVAAIQLNKQFTEAEPDNAMENIAGSCEIKKFADSIALIRRDDDKPAKRSMFLIKSRASDTINKAIVYTSTNKGTVLTYRLTSGKSGESDPEVTVVTDYVKTLIYNETDASNLSDLDKAILEYTLTKYISSLGEVNVNLNETKWLSGISKQVRSELGREYLIAYGKHPDDLTPGEKSHYSKWEAKAKTSQAELIKTLINEINIDTINTKLEQLWK